MTFIIKHEIRGRIRFHIKQKKMTANQADMLHFYLLSLPRVTRVKVYERTGDAVVVFEGSRQALIERIRRFDYDSRDIQALVPDHSGRELNSQYEEKLTNKVLLRAAGKLLVPWSVRAVWTCVKSARYIAKGVRSLAEGKLKVEVLDATAIAVSIARNDFATAGSVMFLLGIGELLEEWTHKKSVADLARSMSLNVDKVWLKLEDREVSVPLSRVREGDMVRARMGGMIPLDGVVAEGQAMINQASMTGESIPVKKEAGPTSTREPSWRRARSSSR